MSTLVFLQSEIGILSAILLFLELVIPSAYADSSSKITINPDADVFVNGSPDARLLHMQNYAMTSSLLQVGIPLSSGSIPGFSGEQLISYIRFNLSDIPNSDLLNDVSVNSAELTLVGISTFGSPDRYFVTVSSCFDNSWSESSMNWETRVCRNHTEGQDSVIVINDTLPKVYSWDVTPGISTAKHGGHSQITFVVTGFPLTYTTKRRDIVQTNHTGFVRFWSKERSNFPDISGSPKLIVTYTTSPTGFMNYLTLMAAVVLPIIGAVYGVSRWIIRRGRAG
jgi:hypothetical protein